jgi:nucleoside-diphosphate-sugar epimerase
LGFQPIVADVLEPGTLANLPHADTVLYAIGYDRAAGVSMQRLYVDGLRAVLAALPRQTGMFIYTSSTGVYGQSDGQWVDEDSPCQPEREGGRVTLAAEEVLMQHPLGSRAVILRMAGIYGAGRIPNADAIRRGKPIAAPRDGYLNLIHVQDAARVVVAAAERAIPPRTYVVSDGHPIARREYYEELARLLGGPPPIFAPPAADSPAALRASSSKRVCNDRMLAELGVSLRYPTFRQGLAEAIDAVEKGLSP